MLPSWQSDGIRTDISHESKHSSHLLKAVNSYLNKKFIDFYDAIDDHDIWISEAEDKYALKNDIPEPVDLTNYALKSDIPTVINEENYSKIETDIVGTNDHQIDPEVLNKILRLGCTMRAFNQSDRNDRWDGHYIPTNDDFEIIETKTWNFVHEDSTSNLSINIYFHTTSALNGKMICKINGNPGTNSIVIESLVIEEGIHFDSSNVYCQEIVDNKFALKSENDELKAKIETLQTENTNLKATIETMKNEWWKNFYPEYTEKLSESDSNIFYYGYYCNPNTFMPSFDEFTYKNVLCTFHDKVNIKHFVRIVIKNEEEWTFYIDEIYGSNRSLVDNSAYLDFTFNIDDCETGYYDEVYIMKSL